MKLSRFSTKGALRTRVVHAVAGVLGLYGAAVSVCASDAAIGDAANNTADRPLQEESSTLPEVGSEASDVLSVDALSESSSAGTIEAADISAENPSTEKPSIEKAPIGFHGSVSFVLPDEVALDSSKIESANIGAGAGDRVDSSRHQGDGAATPSGSPEARGGKSATETTMDSSYVGPVKFRTSDEVDLIGEGGSGDGAPLFGSDDSPATSDGGEAAPYGGYYPTKEEWRTLYRPGNRTDQHKIYPSGLWEWQNGPDDFYSRHEGFYKGVDRVFGILQQDTRESWSYGTYRDGLNPTWTGSADLSIPAFFREFSEERAMIRLGPVFFDLLEVSGTVLYSDYNGNEVFPEDEQPGWLGVVSLTIRGAVKLTPNLYIAMTVTPYWLPSNNDWGLSLGYGNGLGANLGTGAGLAYQRDIGMWTLTAGDTLGIENIFGNYWGSWDINEDGYDRAGRYSFGTLNSGYGGSRHGPNGNDWWDGDTVVLTNEAFIEASRYVTPVWVLGLGLSRDDAWYLDGFEHLGANDEFRARLDYDGQNLRFAPFFQYTVNTGGDTEMDIFNHETSVGIRGPITQNLRLTADAGFFWRSGESDDAGANNDYQTLTYNLSLVHEFGPYTVQSVSMGNDAYYDNFDGQTVSRYISYRLEQTIGHRTRAYFYSIGDEEEYLDGPAGTSHNWGIGGGLDYRLGEYSRLFGSVGYEKRQPDSGVDTEQMLYIAGASTRLAPSLTLTFQYQYEDYTDAGPGDFDESLYILTLTKGF